MKNKKHGLGIYKDKQGVNYIGYWSKGQRCDQGDLSSPAMDEPNADFYEDEDEEGSYG